MYGDAGDGRLDALDGTADGIVDGGAHVFGDVLLGGVADPLDVMVAELGDTSSAT